MSEGVKTEEVKAEESERERLYREKERRARRYGIAPKEGTPLTPPADYPDDPDQYGDPVNYKYPIDEKHIRAAIAYFNQREHQRQGGYTNEEWAIIGRRIAAAASRLLGAKYEYRDGRVVRVEEEEEKAVRVLKSDADTLLVGGWGIVFGGQDLEGDTFGPDTDFWLDRLPGPRPVLYEHGFNVPGLKVLGRTLRIEPRDLGLWVEAELDRHNEYVRMLERLLEAGALGWSSGAVAHLVRREGGKVVSWPIAEFSLTPTPAEPRTLGVSEVRSLLEVQPALKSLLPEDGDRAPSASTVSGGQSAEKQMTEPTETKSSGGEKMTEQLFDVDALAEKVSARLAAAMGPEVKAGFATTEGDDDAVKSFNLWLRSGAIKASLQEGIGSRGGYLVPPEYLRDLVTALANESIIRRAGARVLRVSSNLVYIPAMSYGSAASIVAEEGTYPQVEPTFSQIAVTLYKFGRLAKVSEELLADSAVDIWRDVLAVDFAQGFAEAENTYFTTGSGSGQPQGVVTGAGTGVTTASSTAITADEIIDLYHSLDYKYRGQAVWMMHDSTAAYIRKLKDSNDQYLWQPGLAAGQPDTLLGRPVVTNNAMATIAAGAKVILFGDFRYYWILEQNEMTVQRLDELYAATGQIGFRAFRRVGGAVVLSSAFKVLQMKSS